MLQQNNLRLKREESKIMPSLKLSQEDTDLRSLSTNLILNQLEHNQRLREMPLQDRLKKSLLK